VRPTAQQLLEHPWFSQAGEEGQGSLLPEGNMSHVVARLEAFAGMSRMKRLALAVLCHTVTDRHITRLKVCARLAWAST
jgi:calcium-dependent protein kinase